MTKTKELGRMAEGIAVRFLKSKGFEILDRNWQHVHKELDIIAKDQDILVVVEVKSVSTSDILDPLESITDMKIKYLLEAAEAYLEAKNMHSEIRFDVVTVIFDGKSAQIEHYRDAFGPIVE